MIVMKFGGTSTQDAIAMKNVVKIVESRLSLKPVVVVSAIAQATNFLERAGKLASDGKSDDALSTLQQLADRHYGIIGVLIKDQGLNDNLNRIVESSFNELRELIKGVSILGELTPRALDSFYCYGELLSSRIVAAVLQERGIPSLWIDTKDFMVTDDNFNRAMPMMEIVEDKVMKVIKPVGENGIVPVTQGFIGITSGGKRTTMGRESSDYSASIIGCALTATDIQIWTDVDGVLTADPTVVETPKTVKVLSFEEAFELSYFGAKVLHPNTMLPAIEKNIPIHIYNSRKPNLSGTLVTKQTNGKSVIPKSVAYKRNVIVMNIIPKRRFGKYLFWEHIHNVLNRYNIVSFATVTSEYSYSIVIDDKNNIPAVIHDLEEVGKITISENRSIVCLVGSNLRLSSNLVNRMFNTIPDIGIELISFGASNSNLSFIVEDEKAHDVVRKIHKEFFGSTLDDEYFEVLTHHQQKT